MKNLIFNFLFLIIIFSNGVLAQTNQDSLIIAKDSLVVYAERKSILEVQGKEVLIKISYESRKNVQASFEGDFVMLRMPHLLSAEQQQEQLDWFSKWVEKQFEENPDLEINFFGRGYKDGDKLKIGDREYTLKFTFTDEESHESNLKNQVIYMNLSKHDTKPHLQKAIKQLLSQIIAQDFTPEITKRVNELNNLHFQVPIKSINFDYNYSNWGSCSDTGDITFCTRILFAPKDVIDCVIIHELAHLIELNHSDKFWKLVKDAMPDYDEKKKWLDENGQLCHF